MKLRLFLLLLSLLTFGSVKAEIEKTCAGQTANLSGKTFPLIPTSGTFKMLVVYCKFPDDNCNSSPITDMWPSSMDSLPSWTKQTISPVVMSKYSNPSISGYFYEMSGGKLNIIGDVCPILYIPKHNEDYYSSGGKNLSFLASEIIDGIDPYVNFADYDNDKDGIVDMISICFRAVKNFGLMDRAWGRFQGAASLTGSYNKFNFTDGSPSSGQTDLVKDGVKIRAGFGGSGTIQNNIYDPHGQLSIIVHEMGHYFFGYSFNGSIHLTGTHHHGLMDTDGGGSVMNAYERELLGWVKPKVINSDQTNILIKDALTDGDVYKIKTPKGNYYIENHEGKSFYENSWKFYNGGPLMIPGHGILVSESNPDDFYKALDIKSADGKWKWQSTGSLYLYPFLKDSPNPVSGLCKLALTNVQTTAGVKSFPGYLGDQDDYFNIGYNEVYSPWSNPQVSGDINYTMQLKSNSGGDICVDFYFTNTQSGAPSKPQGLKLGHSTENHPMLSWKLNSEPDVVSGGTYKIYKASGSNQSDSAFYCIATVNQPAGLSSVSFEDKSETLGKGDSLLSIRPVFYKITAVDNSSLESVGSDCIYIPALSSYHSAASGVETAQGTLDYKLLPNFPNPFNATTRIIYMIKYDSHVICQVFDALGSRVADLTDEDKPAGTYSINFDAGSLPSGMYILRLQAGTYSETMKMMLMK